MRQLTAAKFIPGPTASMGSYSAGDPVYVEPGEVAAILPRDGWTAIYLKGDGKHRALLQVMESTENVKAVLGL